MSAILNSPNRSRVALWDTRFVEVSWRNNVFRACYASTILNKGTLLSNGENNITTSHSVSVSAFVMCIFSLGIVTRVFAKPHFENPRLPSTCLRSVPIVQNFACIIVYCKYFSFFCFLISNCHFHIHLYILFCK